MCQAARQGKERKKRDSRSRRTQILMGPGRWLTFHFLSPFRRSQVLVPVRLVGSLVAREINQRGSRRSHPRQGRGVAGVAGVLA